jgi:TonB family protein
MRKSAASASLVLHLLAMVLMFLAGYSLPPVRQRARPPAQIVPLEAPRLPLSPGGGGDRSPLPPRRGRVPEPVYRKVFAPPTIPRVDDPLLPLRVAMIEAPDAPFDRTEVGDPFGRMRTGEGGRNGLLGIGERPGKGIGPFEGNGPGGTAPAARITRAPQAIFTPEPDYSEEARKARFQGTVVLSVEVGADGRTSNIRVVRSAGLGLDEKAVEAVSRWRFRPALAGDHPVAAPALVEVSFHLL